MPTVTRGRMAHVRACRIEDYVAIAGPGYPDLSPRLLAALADALTTGGPAFACTWGDELLLCAGLTLYPWPGVAGAWALLSPAGKARPLVVHRAVSRFLDRLVGVHQLRRVEAHVLEGDPAAIDWIERLGFQREGILPRWGPKGETSWLYARLTPPPIAGGTGIEIALAVGAVAAVAGTAVSATGVIMQAQQQKKAYGYQAAQAGYQEAVANQQVELARVAGAAAEADTRERARRVMAGQRAALGEGGITQEGSPLLVLMDTAQQAELDALRARYSGQVAAHGPLIEADLARLRAKNALQAGEYAQQAGIWGAGSTLLTGATNVAGIYASGSRRSSPSAAPTSAASTGHTGPFAWGGYM